MSEFTIRTPTQEADLPTALQVVYQWNYEPEVEELRNLYVKATEAQWSGEKDLDWDHPIDLVKFSTTPLGAGVPIEKTSYWRSLSEETRAELVRRTAAFRLSQFLHGEQGALMVAAQLVNAVPHTDAKFYALPKLWTRHDTSKSSPATSRSSTRSGRSHPRSRVSSIRRSRPAIG